MSESRCKIPDTILKEIEWITCRPKIQGGQTTGTFTAGVTLYCGACGFSVMVDNYRSQLKNRELALLLFELYLMEIKAI